MPINAIVQGIASRFGYTLTPSWRMPKLEQSSFLGRVLKLYRVDFVLDVGANIGQYYQFIKKQVGYAGRGCSFEPQVECLRELRDAVAGDPLWDAQGIALGAAASRMTLNVMASSRFSSLRSPDHAVVPQMSALNSVVDSYQVDVRRLDTWLPEQMKRDLPEAIFLKLDTQGFDMEVFRGSTGILNRVAAVQTEASVLPLYADAPSIDATLQELRDAGFCPTAFWPVSHDKHLRAVEFDVLFVNNAFAGDVDRLVDR